MIRFFFGSVGCGKTTFAVKTLKKDIKNNKYEYYYSNIGDIFSKELYPPVLADFKPPKRSKLIIDESGIEFNSRDFAKFKKGFIEFFKLHRHENIDIDFYSQTWDDTDKIIRDLAHEYWRVIRLGPFTICRKYIPYLYGPNEETQYQIVQGFKKLNFLLNRHQFMFCFRPRYYRYFDSYTPINRPCLTDLSKSNYELLTNNNKKLSKIR